MLIPSLARNFLGSLPVEGQILGGACWRTAKDKELILDFFSTNSSTKLSRNTKIKIKILLCRPLGTFVRLQRIVDILFQVLLIFSKSFN